MDDEKLTELAEELFEKDYWLIDFLPKVAPGDGIGKYFAAERYFMEPHRLKELYERFARIVIKLNCYVGIFVSRPAAGAWVRDPDPEQLTQWFLHCASRRRGEDHIEVLTNDGGSMLTLSRDNLYMTVYSPTKKLLDLAGPLTLSEGLFLRCPERAKEGG